MNSNCIVTQVHIPDFDVQGSLQSSAKLKLVEFGLSHLRRFNPDSCIILAGHGHRPGNLDVCDAVFWDNECYALDEHGYVAGMPAQFKSVYRGLEEAQERGFKQCLKTRGDCIIGIPDIVKHCAEILKSEDRKLLITQQTGDERMGDCFMFGDTDLLCKTWHKDNLIYNSDGLQNTAHHFRRALKSENADWFELVKATCAFRDVHNLKFTCLRWNWLRLKDHLGELNNPEFDFSQFHWGRANGWHRFTPDGAMFGSASYLWSEKGFYETANSGC